MVTGKYEIEINYVGDGRIFLNYWDYKYGRDVVAEIINGKLFIATDDNGGKKEIVLQEYLQQLENTLTFYEENQS